MFGRMAPPLLQLKDIALTFGGTPLLTGAELSVSTGERVSPGRTQRLGQIDPAEDRGRAGRAGPRLGVRAAGRAGALPAAGAGLLPASRPRSPMSRPGLGRATTVMPRAICWSSSASPARKIRRSSPAAKRAAPRWRACWRPRPISCCSTSRPTISTSTTIEWLERDLDARRTALVIISHDRRFLSTLSRSTVWLDRGADAAHRARLRPFRGMARHGAGGGGARAAQARPQDRRRGALDALRRHRPAQAQHAPGRRVAGAAGAAPHLPRERRQRHHHRQRGARSPARW